MQFTCLQENDKLEIVYDKDRKEPDIEKSTELFLSIRNSVVNNDLELLEHIHTPEQVLFFKIKLFMNRISTYFFSKRKSFTQNRLHRLG